MVESLKASYVIHFLQVGSSISVFSNNRSDLMLSPGGKKINATFETISLNSVIVVHSELLK